MISLLKSFCFLAIISSSLLYASEVTLEYSVKGRKIGSFSTAQKTHTISGSFFTTVILLITGDLSVRKVDHASLVGKSYDEIFKAACERLYAILERQGCRRVMCASIYIAGPGGLREIEFQSKTAVSLTREILEVQSRILSEEEKIDNPF